MRVLGLEPKTYGLKGYSKNNITTEQASTCDSTPEKLAQQLAHDTHFDQDLQCLIQAWLTLTKKQKKEILRICENGD